MYLSIRNLSKKYDLHPDTIRKYNLIQGVHYIKINKLYRYHIENMHKFILALDSDNIKNNFNNNILNKFLV